MQIFYKIKKILKRNAFNTIGVTTVKAYNQAINENLPKLEYPDNYRIITVASGGKALWSLLNTKNSGNDPIDNFTEKIISKIYRENHDFIKEVFYPFKSESFFIDYRKLAIISGIGYLSPYIQMIIHPVYGPWLSLRAAMISNIEFEVSEKNNFQPCPDCQKPCLNICPVSAISNKGYDLGKCAEYRLENQECAFSCMVRRSCVIGTEHAYSSEEEKHRANASLQSLRKYYKKNPEIS